MKFADSYSFIITGGIDLLGTRNFNNLVARLELSINEFHAKGNGVSEMQSPGLIQTNEYSIKQINITPALSILYNFIGIERTKIYGGLTLGFNLSTYPDHTFRYTNLFNSTGTETEDYPSVESFWTNTMFRLGTVINKKVEAGLAYQLGGSFVHMTNTGVKSKPLYLRVSYRF